VRLEHDVERVEPAIQRFEILRHTLVGRRWLAPQRTFVPASVWSIVVFFLTETVAVFRRRDTRAGSGRSSSGGRPAFGDRLGAAFVFFGTFVFFGILTLSSSSPRDRWVWAGRRVAAF
jgi:hypothetical protein